MADSLVWEKCSWQESPDRSLSEEWETVLRWQTIIRSLPESGQVYLKQLLNAFESMQGRKDRGQELHIYLEGDAKKLFKVIRQEGNNYQKQTGNPVFG